MKQPSVGRSISVGLAEAMEVSMTKRFYIDVEFTAFNGKLSIDIDAVSEKQAWEVVDTMLFGRLYQLKTTSVVDLPGQGVTSND